MSHLEVLAQAMDEYASAIRGDWSDFDGRGERHVIESWTTEIRHPSGRTIHEWRAELDICPYGTGHWTHHCAMFRCGTADRVVL